MATVIKNKGKIVEAWELGTGSEMERKLIAADKIRFNEEYELRSQEVKPEILERDGQKKEIWHGEKACAGDFFKVDKAGFPYPNRREWFLANHRRLEGDTWEQLPKPLMAWEVTEEMTPEVQFLIDNKGLKLSPDTPEQYFGAELWGAWLSAASDAVLVFYSVTRDENGVILDADFNFVARKEFEATYHYC